MRRSSILGGGSRRTSETERGDRAGVHRGCEGGGGVKRVLSVGGAGSLEVAPGVALVDTPQFPAEYRPELLAYRQVLNLYRSLPAGELAWTVATPSIVIFPGPAKGTFRTATDNLLFDAEGTLTISSNADFATALVNESENRSTSAGASPSDTSGSALKFPSPLGEGLGVRFALNSSLGRDKQIVQSGDSL